MFEDFVECEMRDSVSSAIKTSGMLVFDKYELIRVMYTNSNLYTGAKLFMALFDFHYNCSRGQEFHETQDSIMDRHFEVCNGKCNLRTLQNRLCVSFNAPRALVSPDFYELEVMPRYMAGDTSLALPKHSQKWTASILRSLEIQAKKQPIEKIRGAMKKLFEEQPRQSWWREVYN